MFKWFILQWVPKSLHPSHLNNSPRNGGTSGRQVNCERGQAQAQIRLKGKYAAFRDVPGMDKPDMIQPDLMHCYNLGFGKDLAASGVIVVSEAGFFGAGSITRTTRESFCCLHVMV